MNQFDYTNTLSKLQAEHCSFACDCGDRMAMAGDAIREAFRHLEVEARRLASQTAFTDAGRGRFSALKEIADWCQQERTR